MILSLHLIKALHLYQNNKNYFNKEVLAQWKKYLLKYLLKIIFKSHI